MSLPTPEESTPSPEYYELPCGARKSSIMNGTWDISNGNFSSEKPYGIQFSPIRKDDEFWLSGEAVLFPEDRAVGLIIGRAAELKIDSDLIPYSEFAAEYANSEPELLQTLNKIRVITSEWDLEKLRFVPDLTDQRISRHHLQISYHPQGVTVVTYDPELGRIPGDKSMRINFPTLLYNTEDKPFTQKMSWVFQSGSKTLRNGDVVIIEGAKRIYCFRYFDKSDTQPARIVKQVYPLGTTTDELHRKIIVGNFAS